jgi:hypothetical protein
MSLSGEFLFQQLIIYQYFLLFKSGIDYWNIGKY